MKRSTTFSIKIKNLKIAPIDINPKEDAYCQIIPAMAVVLVLIVTRVLTLLYPQ